MCECESPLKNLIEVFEIYKNYVIINLKFIAEQGDVSTVKHIFVCVACVIALLFGIAVAEETTIIASGICGEYGNNVSWELNNIGMLTIYGNGHMEDYYWNNFAPWYSNRESIKMITIHENVTNIGNFAFLECNNLMNITIPDSVTDIGTSAFDGCNKLNSIDLPKNLTCIKSDTFCHCESLNEIIIPDGVTSIGSCAFEHSYNLKSVIIPESVTSISQGAFASCISLITIDLPNNIKHIGDYAFCNCTRLRSINLPYGLNYIGENVFENCSSLSSICIPNTVYYIHDYAFTGCSKLMNIVISECLESIGSYAFEGCSCLTSVTIPDGVEWIGNNAFNNCESLQNMFFIGSKAPGIGVNAISGSPTIYCREKSDIEYWAVNNGYTCKYIEYKDILKPASINLPEEIRVPLGENKDILIDIFPQTAEAAIIWESSDSSIVSIKDGVMTTHSVGDAIITATCGELSDQMIVSVYVPVESFELSDTELWLTCEDTALLTTENIYPAETTAKFTWSSTHPWITVEDGKIRALEVFDNMLVFAYSENGVMRSCLVHVCPSVTAIELEENEYLLSVGADAQITANVTMGDKNCVNKLVVFESSNDAVATVDQNGRIYAAGVGTATITVSASSGVSATCTVEVLSCAHDPVIDPAVPATHATTGLTEGSHCSICGEILVAQQEIPMEDVPVIALPAELETIEAEGFAGDSFVCAVLPYGCRTIGASAFMDCTHLRFVEIPESVTSIDGSAFYGCADDLIIVTTSGSEAERFANEHNIVCILYK